MDDLGTLFGRPRPLRAGGRTYRLWPLRLRELARLQEWLDFRAPEVLPAFHAGGAGLAPGAVRHLLRVRESQARKARLVFGSAAANELFWSAGGLTEVLWLSLRRGIRGFAREDAASLYWQLGPAGIDLLHWAVWGSLPVLTPPLMGGGDAGDDGDGDGMAWWTLLHRAQNDPHWAARSEVERMTLPQLKNLLAEGPPSTGQPAGLSLAAARARAIEARGRELEEWDRP